MKIAIDFYISREEDFFTTWGNPHRSNLRFVPFVEYHYILENNCGKQISFRELAFIMMKLLQSQYCLTSDLLLWVRKSFKVSSHNSWRIQSKQSWFYLETRPHGYFIHSATCIKKPARLLGLAWLYSAGSGQFQNL